jgi:hypothetical protein
MSRFKPQNLCDLIAVELATAQGYETANMIRKQIPLAVRILSIVAADVDEWMTFDEEDVVGYLKAAADGRKLENRV